MENRIEFLKIKSIQNGFLSLSLFVEEHNEEIRPFSRLINAHHWSTDLLPHFVLLSISVSFVSFFYQSEIYSRPSRVGRVERFLSITSVHIYSERFWYAKSELIVKCREKMFSYVSRLEVFVHNSKCVPIVTIFSAHKRASYHVFLELALTIWFSKLRIFLNSFKALPSSLLHRKNSVILLWYLIQSTYVYELR